MSRSKQKGTSWETAIVRYLVEHGFPHVERRTLSGPQDRGDIAGVPGWVIEAKNCASMALSGWIDEAIAEQANAGADYAAVWHHRRGRSSPGDAYVTMTGATFARLIRQAGYGQPQPPHPTCVDVTRMGEQPGTSWMCGPGCPPAGEIA